VAGENDVFTVLGKVGVDQKALDAELATTEAKVRASANRQGATWKQASEQAVKIFTKPGSVQGLASSKEGQWWSDPNMAGFADKAAGSLDKLSKASGGSLQSLRLMGNVVSALIPGMGGVAVQATQMALRFGVMAAAGFAAIQVFQMITESAEKLAEEQAELNRMIESADLEGLSAKFVQASAAADRAKTSWSGAFINLIGGIDSATVKANILAEEMRKAFEGPIPAMNRQQDIFKITNAAAQDAARYNLSLAQSVREVDKAQQDLNKARRDGLAQDIAIEKVNLIASKQYQFNAASVAGRIVNERLLQQVEAKGAAQRKVLAEQENRDDAANDQKKAQMRARRLDAEIARIGFEKAAITASNATATAEIESKRALAVAEARFNGERIQGTEEYLKAKKESADKEVDLEKRAAEQSFAIKKQKLQTLIAGGVNVAQYREELDTLAKEEESVYAGLAEKKKQITIRSNQEEIEAARAATAEKIALADKAFNFSVALGQKSFNAEIAQAQDAARDIGRSVDDRNAAELRGISLAKEATTAYFGLRKAMGQETIYGEITAQKELNKTYAEGSRVLIEGQTKVLNLQKQARQEAQSAYLGIAGEAAAELQKKSPGKKEFTQSEIEKQADAIRERREKALSKFQAGGSAVFEDVAAGLSQRETYRNLDRKGGLSGAFDKATFEGFKESTDQFGDSVSAFREAAEMAAGAIRARAASDSAKESPYLKDPATHQASETTGRMYDRESKRGPQSGQSVE